MTSEPEPPTRSRARPPVRWRALAASAAVLSLLASATTVVLSSAVAPTIAGAVPTCAATQPGKVTYKVVAAPAPRPTALTAISSVTIYNLSSGCNGLAATLLLEGNTTGNPTTPATVLSTATSKVNACTTASPPVTVKTGSITFNLCSTSTATDRYVSVHDLTKLTLTIAGVVITVTPTTSASSSNGGSTAGSNSGTGNTRIATAASTASGLAFTGADIAATTIGGLLVILLGLFLLLISRRRRSGAAGDATP